MTSELDVRDGRSVPLAHLTLWARHSLTGSLSFNCLDFAMIVFGQLQCGVVLRDLTTHSDSRGALTELFRSDWADLEVPRQWNVVQSVPNTLRGVHVHRDHDDYLIVLEGLMRVGLYDLRHASPTFRQSAIVDMSGRSLQSIFVPRGVAHGFYFKERAVHIYAMTTCWTPVGELGCIWNDPGLKLPWDAEAPILSARDAAAPSLEQLEKEIACTGPM